VGQAHLRDDHFGSRYKYDVYKEDLPYVEQDSKQEIVHGNEAKVTN
jgi:hypothetical protein